MLKIHDFFYEIRQIFSFCFFNEENPHIISQEGELHVYKGNKRLKA